VKGLRATAVFLTIVMAVSSRFRERILYPGLIHQSPEVLEAGGKEIPGPLGCPFLGVPFFSGNTDDYGAGGFYRTTFLKLKKTLGHAPKIWKYYFMGFPWAVVSGGNTFQKIMGSEFESISSNGVEMMEGGLLPMKSLFFEQEKKRHSYLRKLVGSALTPSVVAKAAPVLQSAAEGQLSKMMGGGMADEGAAVNFQQICTDYTLDVAWRQILGLELSEEEIPVFEQNVATWVDGIMSMQVILKIAVKSTPGYRAREYLISKIEERIDQLLEQGPDHKSTLSGMVFATDDDIDGEAKESRGTSKKLSREEIIDNALILIFAGSETSASTLTNAMLFLGLHPSVWNKLVEEQKRIQREHGAALTSSSLDASNAPYLDAFLKECLRMRTVWAAIPRKTLKEIDVDGDGKTVIPKGYMIDPSPLLTHLEDPSTKLPDSMHLDPIQGFRPERWLSSGEENESYQTPDSNWYVPFGFGPRYCLGKNLADLEMKIFLAAIARTIDFPRLSMLPENYDYSPDKKAPDDPDYFTVQWSTEGVVIPVPADGVLATVEVSGNTAVDGMSSNNSTQASTQKVSL